MVDWPFWRTANNFSLTNGDQGEREDHANRVGAYGPKQLQHGSEIPPHMNHTWILRGHPEGIE
jgi:hypothetical protein